MAAGAKVTSGAAPGARGGYFAKLLAMGVVLAVAPVLAVGVRVFDVNRAALQALVRDHQSAVAFDVASALERAVGAARGEVQGVARALLDTARSEDERLRVSAALLEAAAHIDHVALYDERGAHIDTLSRTEQAAPVPQRVDLQASPAGLDAAFVDDDGGLRLLVQVPLEVGGRVTGAAVTAAPLSSVQAAVVKLFALALGGARDRLTLVDERGRVVAAAPAPAAWLTPHDSTSLDGVLAAGSPNGGELAHQAGSFRTGFVRYGEVPSGAGLQVATVVSLPSFAGAVVIEQPAELVYASLDEVRRTVALAVGVAAALAVAVALLLARRLTRPIRALVAFASALGQRRWDERVQVTTRDELQTLGGALNQAASDLSSSEQALQRERHVRSELSRFLPAPLVERVARSPEALSLGGRNHDVTVLFADVVDFARYAAAQPPERVVALLNELFTILTEIVFKYGGTVDKFMGDSVMAFWGAPEAVPDHAERALSAAREMLRFLEVANARWRQTYGVEVRLAVGINSGPAIVGNVGSTSRLEYTAIGATVNLAAGLERAAGPQQVLLAQGTRDAVAPGTFLFREAGARTIVGHAEPVPVWVLVDD